MLASCAETSSFDDFVIREAQKIANLYDGIAIILRKFIVAVESYSSNFVIPDEEAEQKLLAALGCS